MTPTNKLTCLLLIALFACLTSVDARADDWPRFLGPGGLSVSSETGLPSTWSAEENVLWKLDLPPWGNSSPVVIGDRIYLTTQTEDTSLLVLAVDRTAGKLLWQTKIGRGKLDAHRLHNMATPSVVADTERVWALFGTGHLACLNTAGEVLWQKNMQDEYGGYKIKWGMGSSLVLYKGLIYITCMHTGPSYVVALDGKTGDEVWRKDRSFQARVEGNDAYTTPILVGDEDDMQLVICGAESINAYNPLTGEEIWRCKGLEIDHNAGRSIASPTYCDGTFIAVASGFQGLGFVRAIRAGGQGDITETHPIWTHKSRSPDCPTPVCYDGYVYMNNDQGIATCLDLKTGEEQWQTRLLSGDSKVSPIAADGKIYFFSNKTQCKVVKAGPEGKVLAENHLEGTMMASPAISDGVLYIRTRDRLYAIGEK